MDPDLKWDVVNNRLICQICCEWVLFVDLYVDSHGDTWDICKPCGDLEDARANV